MTFALLSITKCKGRTVRGLNGIQTHGLCFNGGPTGLYQQFQVVIIFKTMVLAQHFWSYSSNNVLCKQRKHRRKIRALIAFKSFAKPVNLLRKKKLIWVNSCLHSNVLVLEKHAIYVRKIQMWEQPKTFPVTSYRDFPEARLP